MNYFDVEGFPFEKKFHFSPKNWHNYVFFLIFAP